MTKHIQLELNRYIIVNGEATLYVIEISFLMRCRVTRSRNDVIIVPHFKKWQCYVVLFSGIGGASNVSFSMMVHIFLRIFHIHVNFYNLNKELLHSFWTINRNDKCTPVILLSMQKKIVMTAYIIFALDPYLIESWWNVSNKHDSITL